MDIPDGQDFRLSLVTALPDPSSVIPVITGIQKTPVISHLVYVFTVLDSRFHGNDGWRVVRQIHV